MTVAPDQAERVIADRLNVTQLEVPTLDEGDWTLVPLAMRAGAIASENLVGIHAPMPVGPVYLHDARTMGSPKFDWFRCWRTH